MNNIQAFKNNIYYPVSQYILICNGHHPGKGDLKYEFHAQICNATYDLLFPEEKKFKSEYRSIPIHDASHDFTDFLDERIGLPINRPLTEREIRIYTNKFINGWIENFELFKKVIDEDEIEQAYRED